MTSFSFSSGIFKTVQWVLFAITYLQTSLPVFYLSVSFDVLLSFLPVFSGGDTNQISLQNSAITCLFALYEKECKNDENY